jgi:hypothetical protein
MRHAALLRGKAIKLLRNTSPMEFSPFNPIVRLCLQGIDAEEKGNLDAARGLFFQAFEAATHDLEKFLACYFFARVQPDVSERLHWFQSAMEFAIRLNDDSVKGAFAPLYRHLAKCYAELGDAAQAQLHETLAQSALGEPTDAGPFYHGTKADLKVGDSLIAGFESNYKADLTMNHIYFTALLHGAGLAAALAKGDGRERVYVVAPTGPFENDPNVTNKKFPGNPTRSYRTEAPLRIVGEIEDWVKLMPAEIQQWRERLAKQNGEIVN